MPLPLSMEDVDVDFALSRAKQISPEYRDRVFSQAIEDRYGNSPKTISAIKADYGIGPYNIKYDLVKKIPNPDNSPPGAWTYGTTTGLNPGRVNSKVLQTPMSIELATDSPYPSGFVPDKSTLAHELYHMRENIGGHERKPNTPGWHMRDFVVPDIEIPILMNAQEAIQRGEKVDPSLYIRYPQLKSVVPLSSNPLALPPQKNFPSNIWNQFYKGYYPDKIK